MALDFPTGDDFPLEGNKIPDGYKYEGYYWDESLGAWKRQCDEAGSGTVFYQDVPPEDNADNDLQEGNLWINSNNLLLHVWTGDEWIEVGSACGSNGGSGGGTDLPFQGLITTRDVKTLDRGDGNNPFELVQDLADNVASKDPTTQDPIDDLLQTQEDVNDFLATVAERTLFGLQRTTDNVDFIQNRISAGGFVRKQKAVSVPDAGTCYMLLDGGAEATDFAGLQNILIAKDGLGPYASFEDAKRGDILLIQSDNDIAYGEYVIENVTELSLGWDFGLRLVRDRAAGDTPDIDESCKIRITRPVPTVAQEIEPVFSESGQLWYDTANDRLKVWDQEDGQFYDVGGEDSGPKPDITGRERVYISAGQDPYGVQEGEISAGLVNDTNKSFHLRPPAPEFFTLGETYIINGIETTITTLEHRDETHALGHAHTYFQTADGINIGPKGTPVTFVGPEEYLRLTGGTLTGTLTCDTNGHSFAIKNVAGGELFKAFTGNYSEDITYGKLADAYGNSKFEIVNRFFLEDYVASQVSSNLTGAKLLEFAQDTPTASLRPGQFTMKNGNTYTNKWSTCNVFTMKATDADGNHLFRSTTQPVGFTTYLGSAMSTLDAAGEQTFMRVVPTGQSGGYVVVSYDKNLELIEIQWSASACSQLMCEGDPYVTNGTDYLIHIPDLFF